MHPRRLTLVRNIASFSSLPLLSTLSPLLVLPILARQSGAGGWGSILTAQAIGSFAAVVIMFGWSVVGQARVALAGSTEEQHAIYWTSLSSRLVIFAIVIPVGGIASWLVASPGFGLLSSLMFAATASSGLSIAWYCIGLGRAGLIAQFELFPRLFVTALSAVLLIYTGMLAIYPLLVLAANLAGLLVFNARHVGSERRGRSIGRAVSAGFRTAARDWRPGFISLSGAAYASAPLPLGGRLLSAADLATLGSGDRLYRYALFTVTALGNALQSWVLGAVHPSVLARRNRLAVALHGSLGLAGMVLIATVGPWVTRLLFGGEVAATGSVMSAYGAAFLAISLSTPLVRNLLIPVGATRPVMRATAVSAFFGVFLMIFLGKDFRGPGIAWALAVSEWVGLLILAIPALRAYQESRPMP